MHLVELDESLKWQSALRSAELLEQARKRYVEDCVRNELRRLDALEPKVIRLEDIRKSLP